MWRLCEDFYFITWLLKNIMWIFKIFTRALILNEKNEVLLLQKNFNQKYWAWNFLLPGWTVEFSEEIEETLKREIKEEVNLEIENLKILGTKTMIIWEEHWFWVYYFVNVKNIFEFKNIEPEKHIFCWFVDIFKEKIDFFEKDLVENFLKNN